MIKIFAQDIALDDTLQAKVAADGTLVLTDGVETGVQDIWLALRTYLGTLFYHKDFGSLVPDWIKEESNSSSRLAFTLEVQRTIRTEPRVVVGSESCKVIAWDEKGITAEATWRFIDEDHDYNLTFSVNETGKMKQVLADAKPNANITSV
jgi:phage baseplate assembly protein W